MGHFGRVVSAKCWGESIRPILVGRFSRESFQPWVVSAMGRFGQVWGGGGVGDTLNFSAYVGLDPASTAYPFKKITHNRHSQINI